ncbi:MAG: hypothetical protein EXR74_00300 [Bdellovibrionales bacterium]|nr:hypothetical protein [Bdellovibrionales bacterium]
MTLKLIKGLAFISLLGLVGNPIFADEAAPAVAPAPAAEATSKPMDAEHKTHENHEHKHAKKCGHKTEKHGDHTDYEHDGHHHKNHKGHTDECDNSHT